MDKTIDTAGVAGWGVDADPKNDPTYPIRHRGDAGHADATWERPPLQPASVEVLHSNERPDLTAAFGTSAPPARLSGALRRVAFRYSESSYGHWLPLLLADRVDMVEGLVDDLKRGRVPNILGERGWNAEWEHNRARLVGRVLLAAVVIGAAVVYVQRRRTR